MGFILHCNGARYIFRSYWNILFCGIHFVFLNVSFYASILFAISIQKVCHYCSMSIINIGILSLLIPNKLIK